MYTIFLKIILQQILNDKLLFAITNELKSNISMGSS